MLPDVFCRALSVSLISEKADVSEAVGTSDDYGSLSLAKMSMSESQFRLSFGAVTLQASVGALPASRKTCTTVPVVKA